MNDELVTIDPDVYLCRCGGTGWPRGRSYCTLSDMCCTRWCSDPRFTIDGLEVERPTGFAWISEERRYRYLNR